MHNFNRRIEFVMECTAWKVLCGTDQSARNEIGKGGSMSAFATLPIGVQQSRTVKLLRSLDEGGGHQAKKKWLGPGRHGITRKPLHSGNPSLHPIDELRRIPQVPLSVSFCASPEHLLWFSGRGFSARPVVK